MIINNTFTLTVSQNPAPPKISVKFRVLRDGFITRSVKRLYFYSSITSMSHLKIGLLAEDGEFTQSIILDQQASIDQGDWIVVAFDDDDEKEIKSAYISLIESGTYTLNISKIDSGAPDFSGNGDFIGDPPDWLTTIDSVPSSTVVRILYRPVSGSDGDGSIVAEFMSERDGSWRALGLNENLKYDIVARSDGCNDVIQSNISPAISSFITALGGFSSNSEFNGVDGEITLHGGIQPYTVETIEPLPSGLILSLKQRRLEVKGQTVEEGIFYSSIKVVASNGVTGVIPVTIVAGFTEAKNISLSPVDNDGVYSARLEWDAPSSTQSMVIYRSSEPISLDNLPDPLATLIDGERSFIDIDIVDRQSVFYVIASSSEGYTLFSDEVGARMAFKDEHWDKVILASRFDESFLTQPKDDASGILWNVVGGTYEAEGMFDSSGSLKILSNQYAFIEVPALASLGSEAITVDIVFKPLSMAPAVSAYHAVFAITSSSEGNGSRALTCNTYPFLESGSIIATYGDLAPPQFSSGRSLDINTGKWIHLQINYTERIGSYRDYHCFINGVSIDSRIGVSSGSVNYGFITLGRHYFSGNQRTEMLVDSIRVTRGVARNVTDFGPLTEPLPIYENIF